MSTAFWNLEQHPADTVALLHDSRHISYGELSAMADAAVAVLPGHRTLGFLCMPNQVEAVALYLGTLRSHRHVPLLLQADMDASLRDSMVAHYQPDWLALPSATQVPVGYVPLPATSADPALTLYLRDGEVPTPPPGERLALLLNTSGSTGSSKLVRHSAEALAANATSIAKYLGLNACDRAITTLPLAYSFGMSILNSHLQVGASLVLTDHTLVNREFWELARTTEITSLSGVPATFEMLRRFDLTRQGLTSLRMFTQAGGRLREALIAHFAKLAHQLGSSFFVMYGQTEAAPRISYVPPSRLVDKIGSIGVAVPGGDLTVDEGTGELIYRGSNVMLGYAEQRADLALGDTQQGILRTGDLARIDDDGYTWLIGRIKRFVKISGNRVNLDEAETMLAHEFGVPLVCSGSDDDLVVFVATDTAVDAEAARRCIAQRYKLLLSHIRSLTVQNLPLLGTGKVDYATLLAMTKQRSTS